jgi:hypothetical protein
VSKAPPPLLGFNNNVRHRGRIFHIQTEDSGVKFARIMTHLFADGGRIVKSTRTEYAEQLEKPDMASIVRGMMKEQHKAMFAALRTGALDDLLEKVCGPLDANRPKSPDSARDPTAVRDMDTARMVVSKMPPSRAELPESGEMPVAAVAQAVEAAPAGEAHAVIENMKALRDSDDAPRKRSITNPNLRKPTPSLAPPREAFDLDVASLDNNPPTAPRSAPDAALSPRRGNPAPRKSRPPIPPRPAPAAAVPAPVAAAAGGDVSAGALGRPATRMGAAPPAPSRSIFGDGAISEQSLDEVILSYLAEDLEESK